MSLLTVIVDVLTLQYYYGNLYLKLIYLYFLVRWTTQPLPLLFIQNSQRLCMVFDIVYSRISFRLEVSITYSFVLHGCVMTSPEFLLFTILVVTTEVWSGAAAGQWHRGVGSRYWSRFSNAAIVLSFTIS